MPSGPLKIPLELLSKNNPTLQSKQQQPPQDPISALCNAVGLSESAIRTITCRGPTGGAQKLTRGGGISVFYPHTDADLETILCTQCKRLCPSSGKLMKNPRLVVCILRREMGMAGCQVGRGFCLGNQKAFNMNERRPGGRMETSRSLTRSCY